MKTDNSQNLNFVLVTKKEARKGSKKDTKWFSISQAFKDHLLTAAMVSLGNSFELPVLFKRLGWRIISAVFTSRRVKLTSRLRILTNFGSHLLRITGIHGAAFTVIYLKSCQLAVQRAIARNPASSLRELGGDLPFPRLSSEGLPVVIPVYDRRLIMAGSTSIIRFWLTLFSLYRVISIPGSIKLGTITDVLTVEQSVVDEIGSKLSLLSASLKSSFPQIDGSKVDILFLEKSSPSSRTSWTGVFFDPANLRSLGLGKPLEKLFECFGANRLSLLWDLLKDLDSLNKASRLYVKKSFGGLMGQLSTKEEAAGKIRVFALVDVWTQSILKPLHDSLFSLLKSFPNDATFDQQASVKRCFAKAKLAKKSFGYDLSAATDRLPVSIQVQILSPLIGSEAAEAWAELLVGREYFLSEKSSGSSDMRIKYSVGQPMGALSSWAMLAVTHHLIVQLAYRTVRSLSFLGGKTVWYDNYELLGDDIVIFDEDVAIAYLDIMSRLGVGINLSKSVIAANETFEFAKVTGHNGKNVSALPWKAFISQNTMMGRAALAFNLLNKGIAPSNFVLWLRNVCKQGKYRAGDWSFSLLAVWTMLAKMGSVSYVTVLQSLLNLKDPSVKFYRAILLNCNLDYIISMVSQIIKGTLVTPRSSPLLKRVWNIEEPWLILAMARPLIMFQHHWMSDPYWYHNVASERASELVKALMPWAPSHVFTTNFGSEWSLLEQLVNAVWLHFYSLFSRKIEMYYKEFDGVKPMSLSLDELIAKSDEADRFRELMLLMERATAKLEDQDVVAKAEAPLKPIKVLLNARKRRPKWTLKKSQWDR